MPSFAKEARALALEALLAHFPNPLLVSLGVERAHGQRLARALPNQLYRLRDQLARELRQVKSELEAEEGAVDRRSLVDGVDRLR